MSVQIAPATSSPIVVAVDVGKSSALLSITDVAGRSGGVRDDRFEPECGHCLRRGLWCCPRDRSRSMWMLPVTVTVRGSTIGGRLAERCWSSILRMSLSSVGCLAVKYWPHT